jgi:hypothetical protein
VPLRDLLLLNVRRGLFGTGSSNTLRAKRVSSSHVQPPLRLAKLPARRAKRPDLIRSRKFIEWRLYDGHLYGQNVVVEESMCDFGFGSWLAEVGAVVGALAEVFP